MANSETAAAIEMLIDSMDDTEDAPEDTSGGPKVTVDFTEIAEDIWDTITTALGNAAGEEAGFREQMFSQNDLEYNGADAVVDTGEWAMMEDGSEWLDTDSNGIMDVHYIAIPDGAGGDTFRADMNADGNYETLIDVTGGM